MNRRTAHPAAQRAAVPRVHDLPVTGDLTLLYIVSLAIAAIMAAASAAGLLYPARVYPTAELRQSFLANDAVNLLIGSFYARYLASSDLPEDWPERIIDSVWPAWTGDST